MVRVKTGPTRRRRHKKVLKQTKGYRMTKSRLYKVAHESLLHAGDYAFAGRKRKKREKRKVWITKLNAAVRHWGSTYSQFISALKKAKIELDRKILSQIAEEDPKTFQKIFETAFAKKR